MNIHIKCQACGKSVLGLMVGYTIMITPCDDCMKKCFERGQEDERERQEKKDHD